MADETATRPQWMDDEFLKVCIRNSEHVPSDSNVQIKDLSLSYVVPKGENYMSLMFRAIVQFQVGEGQLSEKSFMVKAVHDDEELATKVVPLFKREAEMYTEIVPKLRGMLENKNLDTQVTCRYIHGFENPRVLVLDDLKTLGYSLVDRHKGLDLEHVKIVYKKLARFHAAGMLYFSEQTEETKKKYVQPSMNIQGDIKRKAKALTMKKMRLEQNIKELRKFNHKYDKAIESFTKFSEMEDISPFKACFDAGNKFNTMIHSDCWTNNIMFKYNDDGSVEDVLFVDLQICHYSTIAMDFHYLLFSSTTNDVKKHHFHEVKKLYFDSLVSDLKSLEYKEDIPTYEEFEEELRRCTIIPMFLLIMMIPIILQKLNKETKSRKEAKTFNLDDIFDMAGSTASDVAYTEIMMHCVDILQENGYLDNFP